MLHSFEHTSPSEASERKSPSVERLNESGAIAGAAADAYKATTDRQSNSRPTHDVGASKDGTLDLSPNIYGKNAVDTKPAEGATTPEGPTHNLSDGRNVHNAVAPGYDGTKPAGSSTAPEGPTHNLSDGRDPNAVAPGYDKRRELDNGPKESSGKQPDPPEMIKPTKDGEKVGDAAEPSKSSGILGWWHDLQDQWSHEAAMLAGLGG